MSASVELGLDRVKIWLSIIADYKGFVGAKNNTFLAIFLYNHAAVSTATHPASSKTVPSDSNTSTPIKTQASYPFMQPGFFTALEESRATCAESGWAPMHLRCEQCFIPRYAKDHSRGEYVFDYSWADAYQRSGLAYYPKWLTAIPFTPCTGPRWSGSHSAAAKLIDEALFEAREEQIPSWHILFPDSDSMTLFNSEEFLLRRGVQYHWHNRGYADFEAFTAKMNSRKRKMVRRERRTVSESGLSIEVLAGSEISQTLWQEFHTLYQLTYLKRSGGRGYLNEDFFTLIGAALPDQLALACARDGSGRLIAASLFFYDNQTLYGRYWGCLEEFEFLHFELCYYRGIELAIARGLQRFDAGAQGEHKLVRGFEPVETHSLHWLLEPNFKAAVADFLRRESSAIDEHILAAKELLPFKKDE